MVVLNLILDFLAIIAMAVGALVIAKTAIQVVGL